MVGASGRHAHCILSITWTVCVADVRLTEKGGNLHVVIQLWAKRLTIRQGQRLLNKTEANNGSTSRPAYQH